MPGYWILTATALPSVVVARWTWPIEAAANASSSKSSKRSLDRLPELFAQQLLDALEGQRRDVVAQARERGS